MTQKIYTTQSGMPVDPAYLKDNGERTIFKPFHVKSTSPLVDSLRRGEVKSETELLVIEMVKGSVITLAKAQMAYHHVAQGETTGEPWLVCF